MPALEELEQRIARLEVLYEDLLKDRISYIASRLDQIYEKTEQDKTELLTKTEQDKAELLTKIEQNKAELLTKIEQNKAELLTKIEQNKAELLTKIEQNKTELLTKTERDKREVIYWMVGLTLGFSTLTITAMWAILSFALK